MANDKKQNGDDKKKAVRRPSALKRDLQSIRRNLINRSYKAKVSTAIRSLKEAVSQKETESLKTKLNQVVSLMDKGVKKGVYKANKANRVKSQMVTLSDHKLSPSSLLVKSRSDLRSALCILGKIL